MSASLSSSCFLVTTVALFVVYECRSINSITGRITLGLYDLAMVLQYSDKILNLFFETNLVQLEFYILDFMQHD